MEGGLLLAGMGLPELEERRRILNDALRVCNRAKSLMDALDAGLQVFQIDAGPEAVRATSQKDFTARGIVSI